MTVRERNIHLPLEQITAFCRLNPIARLAIFGSVLRDDFTDQSDVDFLVELLPDAPVGLFKFIGMQIELERIVGRKVDLRTIRNFPDRLQPHILATSEPVYVREC